MDNSSYFSNFSGICKNILQEANRVQININNTSNFESKKVDCKVLKVKNSMLRDEIESEERWMRRIANQALNDEENNLVICFKCLWILSAKEQNCLDIINDTSVFSIIVNICDNGTSDNYYFKCNDIITSIFGILGNLCQSENLRNILNHDYGREINILINFALSIILKNMISEKKVQMAIIFLHNLSFCDATAEKMMENSVIDVLVVALNEGITIKENNTVDIIIKILINLISRHKPRLLMHISFQSIDKIYRILEKQQLTSLSVSLLSIIHDIFPAVKDHFKSSCENEPIFD